MNIGTIVFKSARLIWTILELPLTCDIKGQTYYFNSLAVYYIFAVTYSSSFITIAVPF